MIRVGVIGAGSIGREYAMRYLIEEAGVEVRCVVDRSLILAQDLAEDVSLRRAGAEIEGEKYKETVSKRDFFENKPFVASVSSLEEIINDIDAVYIATPPSSHSALTIQALEAGKHVFLEKPLAITLDDCDKIVNAAEDAYKTNRLIVNINIGMRFNAALHEMKKKVHQDSFGTIESISLRLLFRQWPRAWQNQPWVARRAEGGPLQEVGTHWIFGLLEIFPDLTMSACHAYSTYPQSDADDILCEESCSGYLEIGGLTAVNRVEVDIQSASNFAIDAEKDIYELCVQGSSGQQLILYDFTKLRDGNGIDLISGGSYGRKEAVQEFVQAIRNRDASLANLVTPRQAFNAQKIIHAMKQIRL